MNFFIIFLGYIGIIQFFIPPLSAVPFSTPMSIPFAGNPDSPLMITHFFDYQCGFCRKMDKVVRQFRSENPETKIIYRPLPLLGIESKILAQAALAAQCQNKFQLMHEWLMTEGYHDTEENIIDKAVSLGMNRTQFQIDLKSAEIEKMIDETLVIALKNNIRTVPGFMVNNNVFQELMDYNEFVRAIQHSILLNTKAH